MRILIQALALLAIITIAVQQQDVVFEQQIIQIQQPAPPQASPTTEARPNPQIPTQRQPFNLDIATLKRYRYQVLGISFIFIYLFLYAHGKNKNLTIMSKFYRRVEPYLQNNFAHIGFSKQSGEIPFNGQSPSESLYYATGRDNVDGIEMRFNVLL